MKMDIKTYKRKTHYYETDKMGIIHHSNYIRWFEEARLDLLDQIGCGYEKMEEEGIISPVVSVSCNYKAMTKFNEDISIIPVIEEFTGIKLVLSYRVIASETGEVKAIGRSEHCFLNEKNRIISLKKSNKKVYDIINEYIKKRV